MCRSTSLYSVEGRDRYSHSSACGVCSHRPTRLSMSCLFVHSAGRCRAHRRIVSCARRVCGSSRVGWGWSRPVSGCIQKYGSGSSMSGFNNEFRDRDHVSRGYIAGMRAEGWSIRTPSGLHESWRCNGRPRGRRSLRGRFRNKRTCHAPTCAMRWLSISWRRGWPNHLASYQPGQLDSVWSIARHSITAPEVVESAGASEPLRPFPLLWFLVGLKQRIQYSLRRCRRCDDRPQFFASLA